MLGATYFFVNDIIKILFFTNEKEMAAYDLLQDMALFVEVARTGSFTKACARLGMPNGTLSRRIAAMETRLGVRLFERTTRKINMTDAARNYYAHCAPIVEAAAVAHESLRNSTQAISGHIRLSMPVDLGMRFVAPLVTEFAARHPAVHFEVELSSRIADFVGDPVDVALRLGKVRDERLIARHVGTIAQGIFAAPSYLAQHGAPKAPADLSACQCLGIRSDSPAHTWQLTSPDGEASRTKVKGRFMVNNVGFIQLLAEQGFGVAMLPSQLAAEAVTQGRLKAVLPGYTPQGLPVYLVTATRLHTTAIRTFADFITQRFASTLVDAPPADDSR